MALTQMQLIQSLGEAMTWFERELQWGVPATELRHLCGRIGELYAAVMTNGQMATRVNQQGYDVVSAQGEKISVKTTAMMDYSGHISFNPLTQVDRVMVLRMNTEEMQIETLLDATTEEAMALMTPEASGRRIIPLTRLNARRPSKPRSEIEAVKEVSYGSYLIRELESGTIEAEKDGVSFTPVRPVLRQVALELNVPVVNSNGNPFNTRQLGSPVFLHCRRPREG
jgi:uncharacterized protein DUF6998